MTTSVYVLTHSRPMFHSCTPWFIPYKLWFSDVFREYINVKQPWNKFKTLYLKLQTSSSVSSNKKFNLVATKREMSYINNVQEKLSKALRELCQIIVRIKQRREHFVTQYTIQHKRCEVNESSGKEFQLCFRGKRKIIWGRRWQVEKIKLV